MSRVLAEDLDRVLERTRELWDDLRGQRVFFTGGTGFYGCWLLDTFLWANDRLHLGASGAALTRNPAAFRARAPHLAGHPALEVVEGDVRSFAFPSGAFSHVVHAATDAASKHITDRLEQLHVITEGTRRTLEFARSCGAKRFLLASSGAVYGRQPPDLLRLDEEYPGGPDLADPAWSYGEGKRVSEMLCTLHAAEWGLEPMIARGFTFVGPYLPLDGPSAIISFVADALAGRPIRVNSDGSTFRTYLYGADLATWLWTILLRGVAGRPYNVGSERALPVGEVAAAVAAEFGGRVAVEVAKRRDPNRPAERYVPSVARAERELGLQQTTPLEEAIARTVAWYRTAPSGFSRS